MTQNGDNSPNSPPSRFTRPSGSGKRRPPKINISQNSSKNNASNNDGIAMPTNEVKIVIDDEEIIMRPHDFERERDLGRGNYARVELMRHTPTNKKFAVKKINTTEEELGQESTKRRNNRYREFMISSDCANNDFLIRSYGGLLDNGELWLIMDVMDISLDKLYKLVEVSGSRFDCELIWYIASCVINGLEHLYKRNVIHRDVKPSNILTDRNGWVKLCDFGVSGVLENSLAKTFTGTHRYLAPERVNSESRMYNILSDVWSLGITLLELCLLRFPYPDSRNFFQFVSMIVHQESPCLPSQDIDSGLYTTELQDFLSQLLSKSPDDRPTFNQMLTTNSHLKNLDINETRQLMRSFNHRYLKTATHNEENHAEPQGDANQ